MPEHRIERREIGEDELFELGPEVQRAPPPMLERGIAADEDLPLPCPACGYDLRGLKLALCPECGGRLDEAALRAAREISAGMRRRAIFRRDGVVWRLADAITPMGLRRSWGVRGAFALLLAGLALGCLVGLARDGASGAGGFLAYASSAIVGGWLVFGVLSLVWLGFDQTLGVIAMQLAGALSLTAAVASIVMLAGPMGPLLSLGAVVVLVVLLMEMLELDPAEALIAGGITWVGVTYFTIIVAG